VCRRWRSIVFGLPRRLYFYLVCTPKTLPSFTRFSGVTECGHLNSLHIRLESCRTLCNVKNSDWLRGPRVASSAREHHRRLLKFENCVDCDDRAYERGWNRDSHGGIIIPQHSEHGENDAKEIWSSRGQKPAGRPGRLGTPSVHCAVAHFISSNRKLPCGGGVQGRKVSRVWREGVHLLMGKVKTISDTRNGWISWLQLIGPLSESG
jgi:hypothetical protein